MKDPKTTVRYLGFKVLFDGSRRFDFSFESTDASLDLISVQASHVLLSGPGHMSVQECPSICYETLKCRVDGCSEFVPASMDLTPADVAQQRKSSRTLGRP
jgi:hypothetical protein